MKSKQAKRGEAKPTRAETCAIVQWFFDTLAVFGGTGRAWTLTVLVEKTRERGAGYAGLNRPMRVEITAEGLQYSLAEFMERVQARYQIEQAATIELSVQRDT